MNRLVNPLLAGLILIVCQDAAAQLFKCRDAAGKITYSGTKCSDLGLKDAGEVKDRIQVTPAPPPSAQQPASSTRRENDEPPAATPAPAAEAPKEPERRCFTVKTAKGNVTRCNDKPDE